MNLTREVVKRRIKHQIDEVTYHHAGSIPVLATKKNNMSYEPKYIEMPVVSVHDSSEEGPMLVIHSHINQKDKMILSKDEASLLLLELYKFIENN